MSVASWQILSGRLATIGASSAELSAIQASYYAMTAQMQAALDTLTATIANADLLVMLNTWRTSGSPFAAGFPGGGLPFGTGAAMLTGNPADDTMAISAGTGRKLAGGGGGSSTLAGDSDVTLSAPANNQALVYSTSAVKWVAAAIANSVFGRTGIVAAVAGDYTAAQVTNAADKSSAAQQAFAGELAAPDIAVSGLSGASVASRYVGATASGPPISGTFVNGDWAVDQTGKRFTCTAGGSPGTWAQEPGTGAGGGLGTCAVVVAAPTGVAVTDTAAINAARVSAGANGVLLFQAGTYVVNGVTASSAGQTWDLGPATVQIANGVNAAVISVSATGVTIQRGTVDGNSANCTGSQNVGVWWLAGSSGKQRFTTVQNTFQASVIVYSSKVAVVDNDIVNPTGTGIYSQPGTAADQLDVHIRDNRIDKSMQSAASATGYGIQVHGAPGTPNYYQRGLRVTGNTIRLPASPTNPMLGIECWGGCPGASVEANKVFGGTMGISMDRCDMAVVSAANEIYGPTQNGIEIAECAGATVTANTVDGNGVTGGGIILDGLTPASSHCTVAANTVRNLNTGGAAKHIYAIGGDHHVILGNTVQAAAGASSTGVYLQNVTSAAVLANNLKGNGATSLDGIVFEGITSTGIAEGNMFDGWTRANVTLYSGVGGTIDNVTVGRNRHINGTPLVVIVATIGPNVSVAPSTPMQKPAFAATITPDAHLAELWRPGVLTANVTIGAPTNSHQGQRLAIILQQDATGGRTITWNAAFVNTPNTVTTANGYTIGLFVHDGTNWIGQEPGSGGAVASVFTRTGAVTAATGDYTAAQVTGAADKTSGAQQAFAGELAAPDIAISGLSGASVASRYVGATASGPPASGTFSLGDWAVDQTGKRWTCTAGGSPGTWAQEPGTGAGISPVNSQSGTTYTFALSDAGATVNCTSASAVTVTVPPNSSVAFPVGTVLNVCQFGAGQVTIAPGAGVTLRSDGNLLHSHAQYAKLSLWQDAANDWVLSGDLA